jgi:glycosyltransferase involved in cell wall biosynthesis
VLFAPGYSGPVYGSTPMVVTIHDVSFAAHPEWFSWREGLRRRTLTRLSARRAAKVITVSDFSKREIVRHLGVDPATVDVIYSGATTLDRRTGHDASGRRGRRQSAASELMPVPPGSAAESPESGAAASGPAASGPDIVPAVPTQDHGGGIVLYVGSLFNRRHIPALVNGFARLAARHPAARLEIVGDNRTRPHIDVDALIAGCGAADRIRARAYVPDDVLAALYGRATAFAFLSDYEGFGLTPLEALASGLPIVVLDTEVAREIYGPAALYVERPEPVLIEAALERVLFDETERARQFDAATRQLERYSWRECAQRTLQVLLTCG